MTDVRVVLVTCAGEEEAARIAEAVVRERLAACANCVPGVRSVFWWEGKLQNEREVLVILKARADRVAALTVRVKQLHSYSVPEVIALAVEEGNEDYLGWVRESGGP